MENAKSIAQGVIGTSETKLFECGQNIVTTITLMDFANTSTTAVTLNVWKKVGNQKFRISPVDFSFGGKYLAQEDGTITLQGSEMIVATCSVDAVVEYHFNGFTEPI